MADISTVKYSHDTVNQLKNITIPIKDGVNPTDIHTMRYLMELIDAGNVALNGHITSDYVNSEIANKNLVDAGRATHDIDELIVLVPYFQITVTNVSNFDFQISARGNFMVDWSDGIGQRITKPDTTNTTYSHNYSKNGTYKITITGTATGYNSGTGTAAISFYNSTNKTSITSISGGLGKIFSTLGNGANPGFHQIFRDCTGLTGNIPPELFAGISGAPGLFMFANTFYNCTGLTGGIPPGLFSALSGASATSVFSATFYKCTGLTGSIPPGLFGTLSDAPADYMFRNTFYGCSGLTGNIPPGLFGTLSGAPADYMFSNTFAHCSGLSGNIPAGLFGTLSGAPADYMFRNTFYGCSGLTGNIPPGLFGTLSGAPANNMFSHTFAYCSGLTGIEDGIWDLSGVSNISAEEMFRRTFYNCNNITSASPSIAGDSDVKLWQHFSNHTESNPQTFINATQMADYASIPNEWR